jgi:cell division septum initiation protein DivIVA
MDQTLAQILTALFKAHQEIDQLRERIRELEEQLKGKA